MPADVGQMVPDFTLISTSREQLTPRDLIQGRHAVLAFYYFAFSGG